MMARSLEYCCICDSPTGRAGKDDDSIYIDCPDGSKIGPLCEDCFDLIDSEAQAMEDKTLADAISRHECRGHDVGCHICLLRPFDSPRCIKARAEQAAQKEVGK